jgi:hypothetical protein
VVCENAKAVTPLYAGKLNLWMTTIQMVIVVFKSVSMSAEYLSCDTTREQTGALFWCSRAFVGNLLLLFKYTNALCKLGVACLCSYTINMYAKQTLCLVAVSNLYSTEPNFLFKLM